MALRKALGWTAANTVMRVALGFFSAKVSAVFLGPTGMVVVGQINSFMQVTAGAIGNGANTGVVNLTAEHGASPSELHRLWGTAMRLVVVVAGILALLVALAAWPLSQWLLFRGAYWPVILVAGLAVVFAVADSVLLGVLNGLKQLTLIARAGILSTLLEFTLFVSLTYGFGLWGALFAMTGIYAGRFGISCYLAFRSQLVPVRALVGGFDGHATREIARFYPMLLANAVALPLAQILIRNITVSGVGLQQGGYLQAAWRLSDVYVGVLTSALGLYFMAHYSGLRTESARGAMLRRTVMQMAGLTAAAALGIYVLRHVIIAVVLTKQFTPLGDVLPFQLLGDLFRMIVYPLQMALVSQRRVVSYIAQSVAGQAAYVILAWLWVPAMGVQGVPKAYATSYFLVMVGLIVALRTTLRARCPVFVGTDAERVAI